MTTTAPTSTPRLPPRWFIRSAWVAHRGWHRLTGGRRGLWLPTPGGRFGALRLRTTGRRSGEERAAIVGYFVDGPDLVTLAMNGWASPDPAWWLNLLAQPEAMVDLPGGTTRAVRGRAAEGAERTRLLERFADYQGWGDLDAFSTRRSGQTAVVVLEPR
jgi:deazaflavin-dependent oxidoreductase (nitroreductase family)